eukprot:6109004-Lingulodinium_polyedra.AAC.1
MGHREIEGESKSEIEIETSSLGACKTHANYRPPHALQVVAGPTIMGLLLVLQMLKKSFTGKHPSQLYRHIW